MATPDPGQITTLLMQWRSGREDAQAELLHHVIGELRRLARSSLRRAGIPPDRTLQPTVLVNEAYLRLIGAQPVEWKDRAHFFALAATVMRHIVVDHIRRKRSLIRGGHIMVIPHDESLAVPACESTADILELNEALDHLAAVHPRQAKVVELRYFGGLDVEETAAVLDVSANTVIGDWSLARKWLSRELRLGAGAVRKRDHDA